MSKHFKDFYINIFHKSKMMSFNLFKQNILSRVIASFVVANLFGCSSIKPITETIYGAVSNISLPIGKQKEIDKQVDQSDIQDVLTEQLAVDVANARMMKQALMDTQKHSLTSMGELSTHAVKRVKLDAAGTFLRNDPVFRRAAFGSYCGTAIEMIGTIIKHLDGEFIIGDSYPYGGAFPTLPVGCVYGINKTYGEVLAQIVESVEELIDVRIETVPTLVIEVTPRKMNNNYPRDRIITEVKRTPAQIKNDKKEADKFAKQQQKDKKLQEAKDKENRAALNKKALMETKRLEKEAQASIELEKSMPVNEDEKKRLALERVIAENAAKDQAKDLEIAKINKIAEEKAAKKEAIRLAEQERAEAKDREIYAKKLSKKHELDRKLAEKAAKKEADRLAEQKRINDKEKEIQDRKVALEQAESKRIADKEARKIAREMKAKELQDKIEAEKEAQRIATEDAANREQEKILAKSITQAAEKARAAAMAAEKAAQEEEAINREATEAAALVAEREAARVKARQEKLGLKKLDKPMDKTNDVITSTETNNPAITDYSVELKTSESLMKPINIDKSNVDDKSIYQDVDKERIKTIVEQKPAVNIKPIDPVDITSSATKVVSSMPIESTSKPVAASKPVVSVSSPTASSSKQLEVKNESSEASNLLKAFTNVFK